MNNKTWLIVGGIALIIIIILVITMSSKPAIPIAPVKYVPKKKTRAVEPEIQAVELPVIQSVVRPSPRDVNAPIVLNDPIKTTKMMTTPTPRYSLQVPKMNKPTTVVKLSGNESIDMLPGFDKNVVKATFYGKYMPFITDSPKNNMYFLDMNNKTVITPKNSDTYIDIAMVDGFITALTTNGDVIQYKYIKFNDDEITLDGERLFSAVDMMAVSSDNKYFSYIAGDELNVMDNNNGEMKLNKTIQIKTEQYKSFHISSPTMIVFETKSNGFERTTKDGSIKHVEGSGYATLRNNKLTVFEEPELHASYSYNGSEYRVADR